MYDHTLMLLDGRDATTLLPLQDDLRQQLLAMARALPTSSQPMDNAPVLGVPFQDGTLFFLPVKKMVQFGKDKEEKMATRFRLAGVLQEHLVPESARIGARIADNLDMAERLGSLFGAFIPLFAHLNLVGVTPGLAGSEQAESQEVEINVQHVSMPPWIGGALCRMLPAVMRLHDSLQEWWENKRHPRKLD